MYNLTDNVRVKKSMCLKGQCHEILDFRFATGVVETGGKFTAGVVDTGGKIEAKNLVTLSL
jgi:hypothetical protein